MKNNNIKESVLVLKLPETRHVEILAYDEHETRLIITGKDNWTITNKHGLYLEYGNNFIRAVGDLACITGVSDLGFAFHVYE